MVARRTSSGAGFVHGTHTGGISGAVKGMDMYAKLPRELAEGSITGGIISGVMVRVLYQVGTRTDIAVDHSDDATFQINFKLELPSLSCEWATVDVIDALGSRHFNISGEGVYKHSLGASHYLAGRESQKAPEYGETTDLDHYGNKRIAYEVTGATFERMVRAHQVLLVNFHAPWCSHCQRTAPIFEHAAELVGSGGKREVGKLGDN